MRVDRLISFVAVAGLFLLLGAPLSAGEITDKVITVMEKQVIADYYRKTSDREPAAADDDGESGKAGKGKASKDKGAKGKGNRELPKGIAMKLERGGTLPPGIEKRGLPTDLQRQLPERTAGQELAVVEDDVVLIETATGVVLDILKGLGQR